MGRHWRLVTRCIAREGRRLGLGPEDICEGGQDAFFALLNALSVFDGEQGGSAKRCTFASFLVTLAKRAFRNSAKHIKRVEKRCERAGGIGPGVDGAGTAVHKALQDGGLRGRSAADPAQIAEYADLKGCLQRALAKLAPKEQCLVEHLMDGQSLKTITRASGEPYHRVKRAWNSIRARLKDALKDWSP